MMLERRIQCSVIVLVVALAVVTRIDAFVLPRAARTTIDAATVGPYRNPLRSSTVDNSNSVEEEQQQQQQRQQQNGDVPLTHKIISSLKYRELKVHLERYRQAVDGTTSQLRSRLRNIVFPNEECVIRNDGVEECGPDISEVEGVTFVDESDPIQELLTDIEHNCESGHWKSATRKLKKLTRRYPTFDIPEATLLSVLECCSRDRLQAARASEPARKILESLVEGGYEIPSQLGNYCLDNCLGDDQHGTHQGFGGIDTALAMLSTMKPSQVSVEVYMKLTLALAKDGALAEALPLLQTLLVESSEAPSLEFLANVMELGCQKQPEHTISLLNYVKASGYDLDVVGSSEDGRRVLGYAIVAAEATQQDALAFRLLAAASKTPNGDALVANLNSSVQRACQLIHKRAIEKTIQDDQWKLAVRVLELMLQRKLKTSPWIWRNVVAVCAKNNKSRRATGLLMDWVKLYEAGQAEKPVLSAFNTCINACEICDEHDLTLMVLDSMKKTHDTEGNLITFNIALKRLAKNGNYGACEGIIMGMLQSGVEPSVVSYTTAIAACASAQTKAPAMAYEWIKRMRSRNVQPNVITYNTALAACQDGTLEGSFIGSKLATEMLNDVERQLAEDDAEEEEHDIYKNVVPDAATKEVARQLMQQLKQNWNDKQIDKRVATDTVRRPFLLLVDFQKSAMAVRAREMAQRRRNASAVTRTELELEHRIAEV